MNSALLSAPETTVQAPQTPETALPSVVRYTVTFAGDIRRVFALQPNTDRTWTLCDDQTGTEIRQIGPGTEYTRNYAYLSDLLELRYSNEATPTVAEMMQQIESEAHRALAL